MRRIGFLLLLAPAMLHAGSMRFSDVNANVWSLSGTVLLYDPVQPASSSSGLYSGGSPGASVIDAAGAAKLEALCQKALADRASQLARRERLSVQVECGGKSSVLKQSAVTALNLEKELKRLLPAGKALSRTYEIERSGNPWHGLTSTHEQEERNKTVRAAAPSGLDAVMGPAGRSYLYRNNQAGEVIVDSRFFGTLKRADATRLAKGESFEIGRANTDEVLHPAVLIPFLLVNQIVITYWHTGARVTLDAVNMNAAGQCFLFSGEHTYYTNEKNTDPLRFQICVKDKSFTLAARPD